MNFWVQDWLADKVNFDPQNEDVRVGAGRFVVRMLLLQCSKSALNFDKAVGWANT